MTASSKKTKANKKKDFQKPKLKVGKAQRGVGNGTDTNFRAKSIALKQQALSTFAPTLEAQCTHHLGLLHHKSDSQRQQSLAFLTTSITKNSSTKPLPLLITSIIPAVQRLMLDGSNKVRQQLLKLLQSLPVMDVANHVDQLLIYIRAAMTHIAAEIRMFGLIVLDWLLGIAGDEVVSSAGGWIKMLKCFLSLLGWHGEACTSRWSAPKPYGKEDSKLDIKQIKVLTAFIRAGLRVVETPAVDSSSASGHHLWKTEHHMLSRRSNVYGHLNLFGETRNEDTEMYESLQDRQEVFHQRVEIAINTVIDRTSKSGGEIGRAATQLRRIIDKCMSDFGT